MEVYLCNHTVINQWRALLLAVWLLNRYHCASHNHDTLCRAHNYSHCGIPHSVFMPNSASPPSTAARREVKFSSFTLRLLIREKSVPLFVIDRTLKRSHLNKNVTFPKCTVLERSTLWCHKVQRYWDWPGFCALPNKWKVQTKISVSGETKKNSVLSKGAANSRLNMLCFNPTDKYLFVS